MTSNGRRDEHVLALDALKNNNTKTRPILKWLTRFWVFAVFAVCVCLFYSEWIDFVDMICERVYGCERFWNISTGLNRPEVTLCRRQEVKIQLSANHVGDGFELLGEGIFQIVVFTAVSTFGWRWRRRMTWHFKMNFSFVNGMLAGSPRRWCSSLASGSLLFLGPFGGPWSYFRMRFLLPLWWRGRSRTGQAFV